MPDFLVDMPTFTSAPRREDYLGKANAFNDILASLGSMNPEDNSILYNLDKGIRDQHDQEIADHLNSLSDRELNDIVNNYGSIDKYLRDRYFNSGIYHANKLEDLGKDSLTDLAKRNTLNAERWGKNLDRDFDTVNNILDNYGGNAFEAYKAMNNISDRALNDSDALNNSFETAQALAEQDAIDKATMFGSRNLFTPGFNLDNAFEGYDGRTSPYILDKAKENVRDKQIQGYKNKLTYDLNNLDPRKANDPIYAQQYIRQFEQDNSLPAGSLGNISDYKISPTYSEQYNATIKEQENAQIQKDVNTSVNTSIANDVKQLDLNNGADYAEVLDRAAEAAFRADNGRSNKSKEDYLKEFRTNPPEVLKDYRDRIIYSKVQPSIDAIENKVQQIIDNKDLSGQGLLAFRKGLQTDLATLQSAYTKEYVKQGYPELEAIQLAKGKVDVLRGEVDSKFNSRQSTLSGELKSRAENIPKELTEMFNAAGINNADSSNVTATLEEGVAQISKGEKVSADYGSIGKEAVIKNIIGNSSVKSVVNKASTKGVSMETFEKNLKGKYGDVLLKALSTSLDVDLKDIKQHSTLNRFWGYNDSQEKLIEFLASKDLSKKLDESASVLDNLQALMAQNGQ